MFKDEQKKDRELIISCKEMMEESAKEVNLKIRLEEEQGGKYINIWLVDNRGFKIYTAYNVNQIISFIHGLQSDYRP